ncbi:hypothetical protein CF326_g3120 [Tilletia indica]|nr:hypothetical protein CF326_g3120 [Tilletia indica]
MPTPVERQADRQAAELRVLQGLALYAKDGYSLSQAAAISQAPKETIRRRSLGQGAQSDRVANGSQRLSAAEEEALVKYILQMEASGFPLRQTDVEASAQALISARWKESTAPEPLGIHWFSRFVDRHKHRLAFKTKASLSRDRVRGLTKSHVGRFYMILESLLQKYNFDASCILSMDETGVQHGVASRSFKYAVSSQPRDQTIAAREADERSQSLCFAHHPPEGQAAAREKAFTAANIRKGYATTGIWPFNPNAIPEAMFFQPTRSEAELEEAKEDAAWMESELAEQLYSLVGQQRSLKAKSILMQAVRDNKEATATAILFNDLTERIRMHAAAMKAKPRPFRVAQDGGARLYTSDESIAMMQAAQEARQAEDQRKEAAAVEREERREAKEKKDEENRQKQALLKAARAEKRKKEEAEKQQRLVEKLRKRKAREAEEAEKQLRKKRKIDALLAKSGQNPTFTPS